ncbi:translation initiation factor IF-2-like [Schistocerca nitens]|uniref:translation initiation factor IF-2-like n=1 Tax=Schistocerca nitens TaxID=7011 RepID=UPI002117D4C0|nr:translation initiation factor IF-2-like [Schistocerca nitens]
MDRVGDDEEPGPHPRVASPRSSRPEQTHRAEAELASRTTQGARPRHPAPPAPTPEDLCSAMIQEKLDQLRRDRDARAMELARRRDQDGATTSNNASSDDSRTSSRPPTEQHHAMDYQDDSSDSDAPFQEVRRRRTGKKRKKAEEHTPMQMKSRAVPTTNYYAPLQQQDAATEDQHQPQPNASTTQDTAAPPPPKPRIPPAIHAYQLRPQPSREPQQPPQPSFAATPKDFPSLRTPWSAASSLFQTPSQQQPPSQKNTARQRMQDLRQQQQQQRSTDNALGAAVVDGEEAVACVVRRKRDGRPADVERRRPRTHADTQKGRARKEQMEGANVEVRGGGGGGVCGHVVGEKGGGGRTEARGDSLRGGQQMRAVGWMGGHGTARHGTAPVPKEETLAAGHPRMRPAGAVCAAATTTRRRDAGRRVQRDEPGLQQDVWRAECRAARAGWAGFGWARPAAGRAVVADVSAPWRVVGGGAVDVWLVGSAHCEWLAGWLAGWRAVGGGGEKREEVCVAGAFAALRRCVPGRAPVDCV